MNEVLDNDNNIYRIYEASRSQTFAKISFKNVSDSIVVSLEIYSSRNFF